jgi:hypothetical protein
MAITEISSALADDTHGITDQLIAAVVQMAAYEALFGDSVICHTHMRGLSRMVNMRGGLSTLGLDGLLEHLVLWVDANISHLIGSRLYLDKSTCPLPVPSVVQSWRT